MTWPVGVPVAGGVAETVAVNVTDWPKTVGLSDEVTTAVGLACLIVSVIVAEVLPVKSVSPP